MHTHS